MASSVTPWPPHTRRSHGWTVLPHTFIHLPNIGPITEQALWDAGIHTWDDFRTSRSLPTRIRAQSRGLKDRVAECMERLDDKDAAYFARTIPRSETWRMYADFRHNAAFLDIETTGLSPDYSIITLVGILDREGYHAFVYDRNLSDLREALEQYDLIVTFNGASFDLPFIEHYFGSLFKHTPHIDLRFVLSRMGQKGGLKAIERRLEVGRPTELTSLNGYDAVRMWHMWERGNQGALDTLVRYNAEDVFSLPKLAEIAYNRLTSSIRSPASNLKPLEYPDSDLPYDPEVIASLIRPKW